MKGFSTIETKRKLYEITVQTFDQKVKAETIDQNCCHGKISKPIFHQIVFFRFDHRQKNFRSTTKTKFFLHRREIQFDAARQNFVRQNPDEHEFVAVLRHFNDRTTRFARTKTRRKIIAAERQQIAFVQRNQTRRFVLTRKQTNKHFRLPALRVQGRIGKRFICSSNAP